MRPIGTAGHPPKGAQEGPNTAPIWSQEGLGNHPKAVTRTRLRVVSLGIVVVPLLYHLGYVSAPSWVPMKAVAC
eukprot:1750855-Pyramimonas_sp.AAC.1